MRNIVNGLVKLAANFVSRKAYNFAANLGLNILGLSARKYVQNLQTLDGYVFRILQHFATKLCNFARY